MMKPTKENKKKWIERHLNGGIVRSNRCKYNHEVWKKECNNDDHEQACWEAMNWLCDSGVKDLKEAWDKCPNVDWMEWALSKVLDKKEWLKYIKTMAWQNDPNYIRSKIRNPFSYWTYKVGLYK